MIILTIFFMYYSTHKKVFCAFQRKMKNGEQTKQATLLFSSIAASSLGDNGRKRRIKENTAIRK